MIFVHTSASIYLLKDNDGNTRTMGQICSKLTIKTPDVVLVFIVNFEQVPHIVLVFPWQTLNIQSPHSTRIQLFYYVNTVH